MWRITDKAHFKEARMDSRNDADLLIVIQKKLLVKPNLFIEEMNRL